MNDLLIGLLGALLATNQPSAVSNLLQKKTGLAITVPNPNDPVEKEYLKLVADDDLAQAEVDQWITDNQKFAEQGAGIEAAVLRARIQKRFDSVRKAYEDFLKRHPNHARARLAYGSFLNDIQEEHAAEAEWEKARQLNPQDAAAWNNLANYYGHNGEITKAFEYYAKAIELEPTEPVYFQNFATTVYLFRRDATNYFKITEPQVFDKALDLYRKALELDPQNFLLATDLAQSYYGIKPPKSNDPEADRNTAQKLADEAVAAWKVAMKVAGNDVERQGVHIHLARILINADRFDEARKNLNAVTNGIYSLTKTNLTKKLIANENKAKGTNAPDAKAGPK